MCMMALTRWPKASLGLWHLDMSLSARPSQPWVVSYLAMSEWLSTMPSYVARLSTNLFTVRESSPSFSQWIIFSTGFK